MGHDLLPDANTLWTLVAGVVAYFLILDKAFAKFTVRLENIEKALSRAETDSVTIVELKGRVSSLETQQREHAGYSVALAEVSIEVQHLREAVKSIPDTMSGAIKLAIQEHLKAIQELIPMQIAACVESGLPFAPMPTVRHRPAKAAAPKSIASKPKPQRKSTRARK